MKVRMTCHIAGTPSYFIGQVVEIEPRIAKVWVEEGMCKPVLDDFGAPDPEAAAAEAENQGR